MARNFRRPRNVHPIAELNVTNLIDLGFMLLIIFMIVTPLIQQEQTVPVNLPVESKSAQSKPDPSDKFESITIRSDGGYSLSGRPCTLVQLSRELAKYAGQPKPPVFRIRMDAKATAQQFISVMDELKKNNLSRITFDTQVSNYDFKMVCHSERSEESTCESRITRGFFATLRMTNEEADKSRKR